jgi:shikimate kinase
MTSVKKPPRRSRISWINRKASRLSSPYRRADRWGGYLAVIKKTQGLKVALLDTPERILDRIVFYDVDSRPMDKRLTNEERPLYLKEIKQDITYFKKSYTRADLQVSIEDMDVEQAAHHLLAQLKAYSP